MKYIFTKIIFFILNLLLLITLFNNMAPEVVDGSLREYIYNILTSCPLTCIWIVIVILDIYYIIKYVTKNK